MATRGETDWQMERTVLECNRYMLDNEVATDVCFEVGPPDGAVANIRAHKYMLISRSPVFEAMFSSGMSECNSGPDHKIRIEDIEAKTFKDLLMYIYCEHANITHDTSFPLIYAARKYMIPKLVEMCIRNIEEGINESNVCSLLEQSLVFCEQELASKCLNVIAMHSDKFLSEIELLCASRQAIETVLRSNELRSCESLVFEFCLQWAKEQLRIHQEIQNPTDEQIRETLGGLVYHIRFPIMDCEEFAKLVGQRNILSSEEKLSLYFYLNTGTGVDKLLFCSKKRNQICCSGEELFVDRVAICGHGGWRGLNDAFDFSTNKDIVLTGVGLYSGLHIDYIAEIEVLEQGDTVYHDAVTVPLTGNSAPYKTSLSTPITIKAGVMYTLYVSMPKYTALGYYVRTCHRICKKDSVKFTFSELSPRPTRKRSTTTEDFGQIPRLYFRKV